jgi:hypothetical protein
VAIEVTNQAPSADGQNIFLPHDMALSAVLDETDPDEPDEVDLVYGLASGPAHGTLDLSSDGGYTYTPDQYFANDMDGFDFTVSDGVATVTGTVYITVTNDPPVALGSNETVPQDEILSSYVDASDNDDATLTFAVVNGPTGGALNFNSDGTYDYDPAPRPSNRPLSDEEEKKLIEKAHATIDDRIVFIREHYRDLHAALLEGRFPISNAIDGRVFLEENFSGSAKAEACAGTTVE